MAPPSHDETAPLELPPVVAAADRSTWTPRVKASRLELLAITIEGESTGSIPLPEGTSVFGRRRGGAFARDRYMSLEHVAITPEGERLRVRDPGSLNGIFRKLRAGEPAPLEPGQRFRIGLELLRFEALAPRPVDEYGVDRQGTSRDHHIGRIVVVQGRTSTGDAFAVPRTGLQLGRERGDVLFPDDGYVSGSHCEIAFQDGRATLTDLGSSNGTFLRIADEAMLGPGEVLLVGKQLFRIALAPRS